LIEYKGKSVVELNVNNEIRSVAVRPSDLLIDVLRNQLGLTGAKPGCLNGDCGACTVIIDNLPVKSCLVLAVETAGHKILTVEGLKNTPEQDAFVNFSAFQCGYCTSGFLMVCHALRIMHPDADEYVMEEWLESNICRCTSYSEIRNAVSSFLPNVHNPSSKVIK